MKSSKKKAKKAPAKKVAPKKASSKKPSKVAPKKAPAKKTSKKPAPQKAPAKKAKPAKKQVKVAKKVAKKTVAKPAKKVAKKAKVAPKKSPAKKPAKKVAKKPTPKPKSAPKKSPSQKPSKAVKKVSAKKPKPAKKQAKVAKKVAKKTKPAKKLPKAPAKKAKQSPKAVKPSKKAKKETPKKAPKEKPSKSAKVAKAEKKEKEKPAEFYRPQKRGTTGALIISKRGRKSKKEREAAEAQSIFVPRDVKSENQEENQARDARAYSPDELAQLLTQRGVSNMNVFDPKTATTTQQVKQPKKPQRKIILTTLPKAKKKKTVGPVSVSDLFGFNPFSKSSTSQEEKLIPEKWRKYYRKLMERKDALLARLNDHSEKAFQKEGKEETGDVSAYSQHTADIDSDAFDRDVALSRLPAEQEELSEINIAIDRMKKGTYGICEITGKPIPAERLNKVPFTRYSLEGKLEAEKQRGLAARRRRANATGDISEVIDLENDAPVQLPEEEEEST